MDVDCTDSEQQHNEWEDIEGGDAGLYVPPPGEEGMLHSHAGGEVVFQQIVDSIHSRYVLFYFTFNFL